MLPLILPAITGLIGKAIDKAIPDKAQAEELKAKITLEAMKADNTELEGAIKVITAEAQGESWLQRNWRPILMLWFAGLVGAHWLGFTPPNMPTEVVNSLERLLSSGRTISSKSLKKIGLRFDRKKGILHLSRRLISLVETHKEGLES